MRDDPDITVEPTLGLPEKLPQGEEILWQGRPSTWALARDALFFRWVIGYFVLLTLWRVGSATADYPFVVALGAGVPPLAMALAAAAVIWGMAWVMAVNTIYTLTTARVAMRIGAALTLTLNMPFRQIANADLSVKKDGTGTLALRPMEDTKLSYFACWPHLRPGHMRQPEPALRCIPDATSVAKLFADAAETRVAEPVLERQDLPGAVPAE